MEELEALGYSNEVIMDQIWEEFHGVDGMYGTGGIDGQLLGKPSGGGSGSGGSGGGSKPAHTHEYVEEITKPNSCTEDGLKTFKCSCGKSYTEVIPAYGHDYQIDPSKHTDATCTALASDTFVCQNCEDIMVQTYGEYAPHDYRLAGDGKEATCTEQGMKDVRCKRCNEVKAGSEMAIEATGHTENPSHSVIEATAFKDGKKVIAACCVVAVVALLFIIISVNKKKSGNAKKEK